jgi:hypothetical protein
VEGRETALVGGERAYGYDGEGEGSAEGADGVRGAEEVSGGAATGVGGGEVVKILEIYFYSGEAGLRGRGEFFRDGMDGGTLGGLVVNRIVGKGRGPTPRDKEAIAGLKDIFAGWMMEVSVDSEIEYVISEVVRFELYTLPLGICSTEG